MSDPRTKVTIKKSKAISSLTVHVGQEAVSGMNGQLFICISLVPDIHSILDHVTSICTFIHDLFKTPDDFDETHPMHTFAPIWSDNLLSFIFEQVVYPRIPSDFAVIPDFAQKANALPGFENALMTMGTNYHTHVG